MNLLQCRPPFWCATYVRQVASLSDEALPLIFEAQQAGLMVGIERDLDLAFDGIPPERNDPTEAR